MLTEPADTWDEAVVIVEAPVLLEPPTLLELSTEDDVALTVLEADAVAALEEVVPTGTVVGLDRVAEAELVEFGEISVEVVDKADDTEADDVALLMLLDDEVETEAILDDEGDDDNNEETVFDGAKVLAVAVLELDWLNELEGDAGGVLEEVDPTEADETVDPTDDVDDSPVLVLTEPTDEVETEAGSDDQDDDSVAVPDEADVLVIIVLMLGWLGELEGDAVGVLEVDPTEADETVDPTKEDDDETPVLVLIEPALLLLYDNEDCVSLLGRELLLGVELMARVILMLVLLGTNPLVREELVGEVLDTDSPKELELPLLYEKDDCVLLGVRLLAVVLLNVELVAREVLLAGTLSPKLLRVDVAVIELLNEAVLVVSTLELLLVDEVLATELSALLDVELGAREMPVELLSM
ncbi:hypothetical protein PG984_009606 [Apiospora sp. TS-2023a]